jgi:hypothetical protein
MNKNKFVVIGKDNEHTEGLQRGLFDKGYKWCDGSYDVAGHRGPVIFVDESGLMSYGSVDYYDSVRRSQTDSYLHIESLAGVPDINPATEEAPQALGVGANPKQGVGSTQLPVGLVSPLLKAHIALAKHNGRGKYGLANFIGTEVLMSIYLDAIERHLDKLKMGEKFDPVDGVSHIGAIGASLDIILCAETAGTLIDDRPRSDGQLEAYYGLTPMVKKLTELHAKKHPYHYYARNKDADIAKNKAAKEGKN